MRVLFVQDSGINESLVLTEVSSLLRARGHSTLLLLENEEDALLDRVNEYAPDLAFLPCPVLGRRSTLALAERLRERFSFPVALGGTCPTFFPEVVRHPAVAYGIRGECENALSDLAGALERGEDPREISNLVSVGEDGTVRVNPVRPLLRDLDSLPLPDRGLYFRYPFLRRFPWKKFLASRGCVCSCTYCYQPPLRSLYRGSAPYLRRKSVGRVLREIAAVREVAPLAHVHFADDLFGSDLPWLEELAGRYRVEVGIPFSCNTTPELASHWAVWALRRAGCRAIGFGIESAVEERRRNLLGRRTTNAEIREAAARVKRAGLKLVTFNMLGTPGETVDEAFATIELNREIRADYSRVTLAVPVPGTALAARSGAPAGVHVDFRDRGGGLPSAAFPVPAPRETANLYLLFIWATTFPRLAGTVRRLARMRPNPLFALANALRAYQEHRIFRVPLGAGLRYFLHVGSPDKRSQNFVGLP